MAEKIDKSSLLSNINNVVSVDNPEPQTSYNSMAVIEILFLKGVYQHPEIFIHCRNISCSELNICFFPHFLKGLVTKSKLEDTGIMNNLEKLTNHSNQTVSQRASSVISAIKNS